LPCITAMGNNHNKTLYEAIANSATLPSNSGVNVTAAIGISNNETKALVARPLKYKISERNKISAQICPSKARLSTSFPDL
jgi:hypothetical protein